MLLYHVTPHDNQDSIRSQGLIADYGRGGGVWLSADDADIDACQHLGEDWTEIDIWEVDTDELDSNLLRVDTITVGPNTKTYYRYLADIPSRCLTIADTTEARRIKST